ncbi:TonB family protein [Candidatus Magnetominusculus dajiuhuensis]|uniref:energy transducer TonB n=1 Tax=Candidatus Magnetominusculus dajiuhuensis TaxID=3137712 RepID=UPI003B4399BC
MTENQVTAATPQPPPGSDTSAGERGIADGTEPVSATSSPAATTESMEIKYVKAHFGAIRNAITSKLSYPPTARRMGWSGTVKVSFVVNEDGGVSNVKVIETSGHELLDNSAVDTITRGSPYPKPPCRAEIVMPIKFRLDE